ncbi:MAG: hypothetical protein QOF10_2975 [Kribbellaceae bacterium]|jgi:hypothetical protein|nr:hypothetical protein [Kribbellaceae bacterium]
MCERTGRPGDGDATDPENELRPQALSRPFGLPARVFCQGSKRTLVAGVTLMHSTRPARCGYGIGAASKPPLVGQWPVMSSSVD